MDPWIEQDSVFAKKSDFQVPISVQPNVVDFSYFKRLILLDQIV